MRNLSHRARPVKNFPSNSYLAPNGAAGSGLVSTRTSNHLMIFLVPFQNTSILITLIAGQEPRTSQLNGTATGRPVLMLLTSLTTYFKHIHRFSGCVMNTMFKSTVTKNTADTSFRLAAHQATSKMTRLLMTPIVVGCWSFFYIP